MFPFLRITVRQIRYRIEYECINRTVYIVSDVVGWVLVAYVHTHTHTHDIDSIYYIYLINKATVGAHVPKSWLRDVVVARKWIPIAEQN